MGIIAMKIIIVTSLIFLATGLSGPQTAEAQGTTYISNLEQSATGSTPIGSDSWFAVGFHTGNNNGGYLLDSIQLSMTDASGAPSSFTVMLYTVGAGSSFPGNSLSSLSGSPAPAVAGIYTYTAPPNLTLMPTVGYFIVLTTGTPVATGACEWSLSGVDSFNPIDRWGIRSTTPFVESSVGRNWTPVSGTYPQFAINATPVPEPGVLGLFVLGSLSLIWPRRKAKGLCE
jgi:hypothetical protein